MIFSAGISIAFFISALLLVKKDKTISDWILLSWVILNAINLSFFYLFQSDSVYEYPSFLGVAFPIPLLHGVMLYFYVSSVTNKFPKRKYVALFHLVPCLMAYIYLIPFFCLSAEQKIEIFKNNGEGYEVFQAVLLIGTLISGVVYVIWSSWLLFQHKKQIRNQFSDLEEINLRWLQFLTYGLGLVWLLVIFTRNDVVIYSGVSVFIILIGFFGLQQKDIFKSKGKILSDFNSDQKVAGISPDTIVEKEKYQSSGLSDSMAKELHEKLNVLMQEEKLFKNPALSLSDLASSLDTHSNYLSQILNEKENQSFYDYVNTYRVTEFKRLIAIPENQSYTLLALAYDCGFNSKSSFNRYFKKATKQTPSEFIKSIKG